MRWLKRHWWWIAGICALAFAGAWIACIIVARRIVRDFEPMARAEAVTYLSERFHSAVTLGELHISSPTLSVIQTIERRGRGVKVHVEADNLSMRFVERPDLPEMFSMRRLTFVIDLGTLLDQNKVVDNVQIEGMIVNVPPKGSPQTASSASLLPVADTNAGAPRVPGAHQGRSHFRCSAEYSAENPDKQAHGVPDCQPASRLGRDERRHEI